MLSPDDADQARQNATAHFQMCIDRIAVAADQPAHCWLTGPVYALIRDRSAFLRRGDTIRLRVDTRYRAQRCPPGDDQRLCIEDLMPGARVIVFADAMNRLADGIDFQVVLGQAELLPADRSRSERISK